MKSWMTSERGIVMVIGIVLLVVASVPTIRQMSVSAPQRGRLLMHNSRSDYPVYLAFIKQGIEGNILTRNPYAIEDHDPVLYLPFFGLTGYIAGMLRITDPRIVYHLSRYVFAIVWMFAVYLLCQQFVPRKWQRIVTFGLILTSASIPVYQTIEGQTGIYWLMGWWTELDPTKRLLYLPHHLFGHALVLFTIVFWDRYVQKAAHIHLAGAIMAAWIAGFVHPPSLLLLLMVIPVYTFVRRKWRRLIGLVPFVGISLTSALLVLHYINQTPCDCWYESLSFAIDIPEYLMALGPIVPMSLLALPVIWKRRRLLIFALWAVMSSSMVYISRQLLQVDIPLLRAVPLSNIRFLQHALWVPLSLLAVYGMWWVKKRVHHAVFATAVLVIGVLTFIGYPSSIEAQLQESSLVNDFETPPADWFDAMSYIDMNSSGPVLALQHASVYIPAFAGNTVYVGRRYISKNFEQKAGEAYVFFAGMEECEAYDLVEKHDISLVFYGFDERSVGSAVQSYSFLKPVYESASTIVYEVVGTSNCAS